MSVVMRLATGATLSLALISAPVAAHSYRDHHGGYGYRHHRGIDAFGGFLLGAVVLGTVAVIASGNRDGDEMRYTPQPDDGYSGDRAYDERYARSAPQPPTYGDVGGGDSNADRIAAGDPVDDCARAAERRAQTGGGFARVVGIDAVDAIAGGANVRGRLEIDNRDAPARGLRFACTATYGQIRSLRLG